MNPLQSDQVWPILHQGGSARLADDIAAKFVVGDTVLARRYNHPGHIRLPEYVQGHRGVVAADHGVFIFPDRHAKGIKEAQRLYSVKFDAAELWADGSGSKQSVFVDLFESYLVAI